MRTNLSTAVRIPVMILLLHLILLQMHLLLTEMILRMTEMNQMKEENERLLKLTEAQAERLVALEQA